MQTTVSAQSMLFSTRQLRTVRTTLPVPKRHLIVLAKQRKQPASHPVGAPNRSGRAESHLEAAASAAEPATSFRIIIQGRNVSVTPAIKQHLESKLISQQPHQIDVKVKVHGGDATKGPRDQVTEVTVYTFRNGVVRVVERAESLYASIDLMADKLARNMRKLKEKALPKGKWPGHRATVKGGAVITEVLDASATVDELPIGKAALPTEIIRTKHFLLEPMDVDEAIEQLQFMSHDFFLFQDKATNTVQVLYRRHAGGYGIIVPEVQK